MYKVLYVWGQNLNAEYFPVQIVYYLIHTRETIISVNKFLKL